MLPPDKVQAAFDDAVKAGQDRERLKNEGQAYANDVVPRARGMASRLLEEANGYNTEVVQKSEGDASRFRQIMTEYDRAPAVTRQRLYLEAVQQVYTNTTKILVDQKSGSNLLFLPLDKILQMSASGAVAAADTDSVGAAESQPSTAPAADPRSREAFRNRDREARP